MDNLAHTLVGLALARGGLGGRTRLGTAILVIGANLPDVDVLSYFDGRTAALAFRRGWTHGVLAMAVLPLTLAAAATAWSRWDRDEGAPFRPREALALAAVAIWSHPLLDLLNNYGVRLLMPFSDRWFYGDALFIIDPWVWIALLSGTALSKLRAMRGQAAPARPARVALLALAAYALLMMAAGRMGRLVVQRAARAAGSEPALRTMAAPAPVTPAWRMVVRDLGGRYEVGELRWGAPSRYEPRQIVPATPEWSCGNADPAALVEAARSPDAQRFLRWARFPRMECDLRAGKPRLLFSDVRYTLGGRAGEWATVVVPLQR